MSFCALLRGIVPMNPSMRNDRLRAVFEGLGFTGVSSVLASGNIVFRADGTDVTALEDSIQAALNAELGIPGGTIVRTRAEIAALVAGEPFGALEHGSETYLTATFLKRPPNSDPRKTDLPELPNGRFIGYDAATRCVLAVSDNSNTPDVMAWLEGSFGKEITTRTWLSVQRIFKKMPL